jgi:septal ring factor EnvC (AmiA/AmiB activator)
MTTLLIIAGYSLAVIFAGVCAILSGSLKTTKSELAALSLVNDDLRTLTNAMEKQHQKISAELKHNLEKESTSVAKLEQQLKNKKTLLETALNDLAKYAAENASVKIRLSKSYERVGKRFQKVGKVA